MKRLVVILIPLLVIGALVYMLLTRDVLTKKERAWIEGHGVIRVAYTNDYPPINFTGQDGRAQGISIDYWRLLAEKMGIEIEFHPNTQLKEQLEGIKDGRFDSFSGTTALSEDAEHFDFTQPYMNVNTYIFVQSKHDHSKGFGDIEDIKLGVVRGHSGYMWIRTAGIRPRKFSNYTDTILGLIKGKVGAIVMDEPVMGYLSAKYKLEDKIERGGLVNRGKLVLAVKKGNGVLFDILKKGVGSISPEETRKISVKWFATAPLCKECVIKFGSLNR